MFVAFLLADTFSIVLAVFQHFQLKFALGELGYTELFQKIAVPSILLMVLTVVYFCLFAICVWKVYVPVRLEGYEKMRVNSPHTKEGSVFRVPLSSPLHAPPPKPNPFRIRILLGVYRTYLIFLALVQASASGMIIFITTFVLVVLKPSDPEFGLSVALLVFIIVSVVAVTLLVCTETPPPLPLSSAPSRNLSS